MLDRPYRGDPRGVPADAATVGFVHSDDWRLEDGMWVPDRGDDDRFDPEDPDVWMGVVDPDGEPISPVRCLDEPT